MSRGLGARRSQCAGMEEIVGLSDVRRAQDIAVLYGQVTRTATSDRGHRCGRQAHVDAESSRLESTRTWVHFMPRPSLRQRYRQRAQGDCSSIFAYAAGVPLDDSRDVRAKLGRGFPAPWPRTYRFGGVSPARAFPRHGNFVVRPIGLRKRSGSADWKPSSEMIDSPSDDLIRPSDTPRTPGMFSATTRAACLSSSLS